MNFTGLMHSLELNRVFSTFSYLLSITTLGTLRIWTRKEIYPHIRKIRNVKLHIIIMFIVYHKLSSVDVFDFDNYLNQFEGKNQDFMDKLVKT